MIINNNLAAQSILNEAARNEKKKGKALKQLGLGERITGAGDDASGYAITERMKIQMRGLGQDQQNVKNGADMLRVAEGAIQSQINLLRTVKEKVIQAANDTNTDADRLTIQKEINHCYEEINDISAETTYNGKQLLIGDAVEEKIGSWVVLDHAVPVEDSDSLNFIPDTISDDLDGEPGPFATFGSASDSVPYDGYNSRTVSATNISGYDKVAVTTATKSEMHGGTANAPKKMEIDLSGYANAVDLDNVAFTIKYGPNGYSRSFVLTTDTSRNYSGSPTEILIKDKDKAGIANAIKTALSSYFSTEVSGEKIILTSKDDGTAANSTNSITGLKITGGTSSSGTDRTAAPASGLGDFKLSGGKNAVYETKDVYDPVTDMTTPTSVLKAPATAASVTKSLTGVSAGSGITIRAGSSYKYLVFKDDASAPVYDSAKGYYTVGKNYTGSFNVGDTGNYSYSYGMKVSLSGGSMTLTAYQTGTKANNTINYSVSDGVTASSKTSYTNTAAEALKGYSTIQDGANGDTAYWEFDLSAYDAADGAAAEKLIDDYLGEAFRVNYVHPYTSDTASSLFEFIDTGSNNTLDGEKKLDSSTVVDLNAVRAAVKDGTTTAAKAFAQLLKTKVGKLSSVVTDDGTDTGKVVGFKLSADIPGTSGNKQYLSFTEGDLRDYTIDFKKILADKGLSGSGIAEALDDKGFRFYCATDSSQWVNVHFVNGLDKEEDDRPASGITGVLDIKTVVIDVSGVMDAVSLVNRIYDGDGTNEGLADYLQNKYKHFFQVAKDTDNGTLTIFDNRKFNVLSDSRFKDKQEKGAKIADGILDNVVKDYRYLYVKDLYIQHTTQASKNIHIKIPQTSMDQIFGYKIGTHQIEDFNVLTKEMRDKLLGSDGPPKVEGILDAGLQYLIDANTLIGAQINHMEYAEQNIVTELENVTASESVMRDTDMAKAMTEFTKFNILGQAAQSMLAQANQTPQSTLSLLQ